MDITHPKAFLAIVLVVLVQVLIGLVLYTRIKKMYRETIDLIGLVFYTLEKREEEYKDISMKVEQLKVMLDEVLRSIREVSNNLNQEIKTTLNNVLDELSKKLEQLEGIEQERHEELIEILKELQEPINIDEVLGYDRKQ
ncbi:MAG: hypothetical protein KNN13_01305 [Hydrogenobacter thermophilus]|uniref:hypothetical protein n=1 Tax=Hydrogenobacter thermophilus TaxID=940 RepID=UPI001C77169E|nr:hypothetical protein [Hydrogenobacter thermophilus]QWK19996.1 MAG: hypothetical protein KNN13_01305 [Hydrogenobacter thermophilus]